MPRTQHVIIAEDTAVIAEGQNRRFIIRLYGLADAVFMQRREQRAGLFCDDLCGGQIFAANLLEIRTVLRRCDAEIGDIRRNGQRLELVIEGAGFDCVNGLAERNADRM